MSNLEVSFEYIKTLEKDKNVLLIDVREPKELQETGILPGSINIPLSDLEKVLTTSTSDEFRATYEREKPTYQSPIVFSCRSGRRSLSALFTATKLGYTKATHFPGGWLEWEEKQK